MMALLFAALSFSACSSDDAEEDIDTYLKGKWYSYKAVVSAQNRTVDLDVSKTGQNSQLYYETVFKDGGKLDMSYYRVVDAVSSWVTESGTYSVNGNIVTLDDGQSTMDAFYNPKEKNLYIRLAANVENIGYTTVFIYFRK